MFGLWFVVLPDGEAAEGAVRVVRPHAQDVVEHASGRPWLMGVWPRGHVAVGRAGTARAAVIGSHPPDEGVLSQRLGGVREAGGADRVAAGLAGDFHLVASIGGRVRARGTAAGARRVFHTLLGGVSVAGCRADTLAGFTGAAVDEDVLALRLTAVPVLYPLEDRCVWRGVIGVRPDECLFLDADGRAGTARWWDPPAATASFEEGARAVGRALTAAVGARTAAGGTVSADLSGGMDSTSVCFLAAAGPARLLTTHWQGLDEANEDSGWARRAAAGLPHADHEFITRQDTPAWFADAAQVPAPQEEPCGWARDRTKLVGTLERMAARGSRLHLSGGGGDQLFSPASGHTHDVLRVRPLTALAELRRRKNFTRQPLLPALRALTDRTTFADHLARAAHEVTVTHPPTETARTPAAAAPFLWGPGARLPAWATPQAREQVAALLRTAACGLPEPLSPQRATHWILQELRAGGDTTRRLDQFTHDTLGIGYATPYTDDAVIEAVLSVRPHERVSATGYKPLLAAAMHGIVPAPLLARSTKGQYAADVAAGLRRSRRDLLELFEDSLLARAGLIDTDALRVALHAPPTHALHTGLIPTLACEQWLRSLPRPRTHPVPAATKDTR